MKFDPPLHVTYSARIDRSNYDETFNRYDTVALAATFVCIAKDDNSSTVEFTVDRINFSLPKMIDSAFQQKLFGLLAGYSATAVVSRSGWVASVTVRSGIIDSLSKAMKETRTTIREIIGDYLSENAIKDYFNRILTAIPAKETIRDSIWSNTIVLVTKAPVKVSTLYKLLGVDNDTLSLGLNSVVSGRQGEGGNVYLKGEQTGREAISYSTGIPYYYETSAQTHYSAAAYDVKLREHFLFSCSKL